MAKRIVVLASSRGTNFQSIVSAIQDHRIENATCVGLVTHNPKAGAIQIAQAHEVPVFIVDSSAYLRDGTFDKTAYETQLLAVLKKLSPDLICLAGYMRILGNTILKQYPNQIINIHPSLLPAFRGLHAQQQALDSGAQWTGCTVHFVTEELDAGKIVAQTPVPIQNEDTLESLSERILRAEHPLYVKALQQLCTTTAPW